MRGVTYRDDILQSNVMFQSTHPMRGVTVWCIYSCILLVYKAISANVIFFSECQRTF